jgi:hypothetical protein
MVSRASAYSSDVFFCFLITQPGTYRVKAGEMSLFALKQSITSRPANAGNGDEADRQNQFFRVSPPIAHCTNFQFKTNNVTVCLLNKPAIFLNVVDRLLNVRSRISAMCQKLLFLFYPIIRYRTVRLYPTNYKFSR